MPLRLRYRYEFWSCVSTENLFAYSFPDLFEFNSLFTASLGLLGAFLRCYVLCSDHFSLIPREPPPLDHPPYCTRGRLQKFCDGDTFHPLLQQFVY